MTRATSPTIWRGAELNCCAPSLAAAFSVDTEETEPPTSVADSIERSLRSRSESASRPKLTSSAAPHWRPLGRAGAAGGQLDPTQVKVADLSQTIQDPLLAKVRSLLRRDHGFPRDGKRKFSVLSVFSTEALRYPTPAMACEAPNNATGLNCSGFGSSVCVTSVFGMVAAAQTIKIITQKS